MPPTLAAAIITILGLCFLRKIYTDFWSSKSNFFLSTVKISLYPLFLRALRIAEPTKPLCPAKKFSLYIIYDFKLKTI